MNAMFTGLACKGLASAFALCVVASSGCSDSDSSSPPVGEDAAETGAAMSQEALVGLEQILTFEVPTPTGAAAVAGGDGELAGGGRLGLFSRLGLYQRFSSLTAGAGDIAAATESCTSGGTVSEDCTSTETQSTFSLSASNCQEDFEGISFLANGSLQVIADDPTACDTGVESADSFTSTFTSFTFTLTGDGVVVARVQADGTIAVTGDTEVACGATGGSLVGNYTIQLFSAEEEIDIQVSTTNLSLVVVPGTDPCENVLTVNGVLDVIDRVANERVRQTFEDLVITILQGETSTSFSINGVSGLACLGNVEFETVEPLVIPDDSDCPVAGVLRLTIVRTGEVALVTFNADGTVDIDLGEDGSVERTRPSCQDLRAACSA